MAFNLPNLSFDQNPGSSASANVTLFPNFNCSLTRLVSASKPTTFTFLADKLSKIALPTLPIPNTITSASPHVWGCSSGWCWGLSKLTKYFSIATKISCTELFKIAPRAKLKHIVHIRMENVSEFKRPLCSQEDISINENSE